MRDRDLERQLAQGPPGGRRALAGARRAGHPAAPGDEADRRRRAGHGLRDGRVPAGPPRRGPLERRRHRRPATGSAIADVVTNFGDGPVRDCGPGGAGAAVASEDDFNPFDEARMVAATVDGLRIVSLYAPNGRVVGSPFYTGKLAWFERLARWIDETGAGSGDLLIGGDLNIAPTDADVWDAAAVHGGTHVSEPERAAFRALLELGLTDAYRARHAGDRPIHLVGLPGREVPQEPGHADRPSARLGVRGGPDRRRRDRPRRPQGTARSRPTTRRCSWTSTSPGAGSPPTGTRRSAGSRPGLGRCRGARSATRNRVACQRDAR